MMMENECAAYCACPPMESSSKGSGFGFGGFFSRLFGRKKSSPPPPPPKPKAMKDSPPPPPPPSSSSSAPVVSPSGSDALRDIITLQAADGLWNSINDVAAASHVEAPADLAQITGVSSLSQSDLERLLATLLAISILRKTYMDRKPVWNLVERKALDHIAQLNLGLDVDAVIGAIVAQLH